MVERPRFVDKTIETGAKYGKILDVVTITGGTAWAMFINTSTGFAIVVASGVTYFFGDKIEKSFKKSGEKKKVTA